MGLGASRPEHVIYAQLQGCTDMDGNAASRPSPMPAPTSSHPANQSEEIQSNRLFHSGQMLQQRKTGRNLCGNDTH